MLEPNNNNNNNRNSINSNDLTNISFASSTRNLTYIANDQQKQVATSLPHLLIMRGNSHTLRTFNRLRKNNIYISYLSGDSSIVHTYISPPAVHRSKFTDTLT